MAIVDPALIDLVLVVSALASAAIVIVRRLAFDRRPPPCATTLPTDAAPTVVVKGALARALSKPRATERARCH